MVCRENIGIERAGLVAAVEQAADAIVITDTSGTIRYVNPAFTALTGYGKAELVGQNPRFLKSGETPSAVYHELWNTVLSGRVWHGEVINLRKDGTRYCEEMQITPVEGLDGEIVNYIAVKRDVTRARAAQDAQAFLATIVQNSEDAMVAFSPDGTILTWNRGAEMVFGYSAANAIGKPYLMLLPPDRQHVFPGLLERAHGGLRVSDREGIGLHRDGRRIPLWVSGSPVLNAAGKLVAMSMILRDVTDLQKAERDRAVLASIVESSEDAVFSVGTDGTLVSWNRGAERLLGYASCETIGKPFDIVVRDGRREAVAGILQKVREGRPVEPYDAILRSRQGEGIAVSITISAVRNPAGELVGASAIARDVRQRRETERRVQESEERFRSVFENAPAGMMLVTADGGQVLQANTAFCQMLGYSREEMCRTTWMALTHPDDMPASLRRVQTLLADPDARQDVEKRYLHRSGAAVWTRVRVSAICDSEGRPQHLVVHAEDITERKRAAEALRESEERFRIMADGCPSAMWVTDENGGTQFVNREWRKLLGVTYEDAEGERWRSVFHPEDADGYLAGFARASTERTSFRGRGSGANHVRRMAVDCILRRAAVFSGRRLPRARRYQPGYHGTKVGGRGFTRRAGGGGGSGPASRISTLADSRHPRGFAGRYPGRQPRRQNRLP